LKKIYFYKIENKIRNLKKKWWRW